MPRPTPIHLLVSCCRWNKDEEGSNLGYQVSTSLALMPTVDSSVWGLPRWTAEYHPISWSTTHQVSLPLFQIINGSHWSLEESPNSLALVSEALRVGSCLFPVLLSMSVLLTQAGYFHAPDPRNGYSLCFTCLPSVAPGQTTLFLLFTDGPVTSVFRGLCGQDWESSSYTNDGLPGNVGQVG